MAADDPIKRWAKALESANKELFTAAWPDDRTPRGFGAVHVFAAAVGRVAESLTRFDSKLLPDRLDEMSRRVYAATYPSGTTKKVLMTEIVREIADVYWRSTSSLERDRHYLGRLSNVKTSCLRRTQRLATVVDARFRKLDSRSKEVLELFDRYRPVNASPRPPGWLGAETLTVELNKLAGWPLGKTFTRDSIKSAKRDARGFRSKEALADRWRGDDAPGPRKRRKI